MTQAIRNSLFSLRDLLLSFGPFILAALLLLGLTYWWMDPTPPSHIILATGPAQSDYAAFGKQYADLLKPYGINVELKPTKGSLENLNLLRAGKVDFGFVQGGNDKLKPEDSNALVSLGSLFVEPIWVFYRADRVNKLHLPKGEKEPTMLSQLKDFKLNFDLKGSGVSSIMRRLFEANHIDIHSLTISHLAESEASAALLAGDLDAIVLIQAPQSNVVQNLIRAPHIKLMDFAQSDAFDNLFPFLSAVTLHRGIADLGQDTPASDIHLIAPTTSLIARDTTHPALLLLFSIAAGKLHSTEGWFNKTNEFPNESNDELPIAAEADRYMKNGLPYLQRHMPFWLANLIDRMWVVMGGLLVIFIPLSKILPPLYKYRIRRRIFKAYSLLKEIEEKAKKETTGAHGHIHLLSHLEALERRVEHISVPLSYAEELFSLRSNIQLVHRKLLQAAT